MANATVLKTGEEMWNAVVSAAQERGLKLERKDAGYEGKRIIERRYADTSKYLYIHADCAACDNDFPVPDCGCTKKVRISDHDTHRGCDLDIRYGGNAVNSERAYTALLAWIAEATPWDEEAHQARIKAHADAEMARVDVAAIIKAHAQQIRELLADDPDFGIDPEDEIAVAEDWLEAQKLARVDDDDPEVRVVNAWLDREYAEFRDDPELSY